MFDENELTSKGLWWGGIDKDGILSCTSDDEEPEPPEHLHWDSDVKINYVYAIHFVRIFL